MKLYWWLALLAPFPFAALTLSLVVRLSWPLTLMVLAVCLVAVAVVGLALSPLPRDLP